MVSAMLRLPRLHAISTRSLAMACRVISRCEGMPYHHATVRARFPSIMLSTQKEGRLPFVSRPDSVVDYAVFIVPRLEDVLCAELHLVGRTPAAAFDASTVG